MGHFLEPLIDGRILVCLVGNGDVCVAVPGLLWAQAWRLEGGRMAGTALIHPSLIHGAFCPDEIPVDRMSSNNFGIRSLLGILPAQRTG